MIHFKFVGVKSIHKVYYLGLSGERSLPIGLLVLSSIDTRRWHKDMFAFFTANMDVKTSVQLQLSKSVSTTFEAHGPPRGRSFR